MEMLVGRVAKGTLHTLKYLNKLSLLCFFKSYGGLGAEASESQTVNQVCTQWMVASRRATYGATTLKSAV